MSKNLLDQLVKEVTKPIIRKRIRWGRNWLCLCSSGKKYKRCCMGRINKLTSLDDNASIGELYNDIEEVVRPDKEVRLREDFNTDIVKSLGIPASLMNEGNSNGK